MILGKCIYSILTNDTDISAIVGTKVFPALAIEDVAYPYIAYEQEEHETSDTKDGKSCLDIIRYDIEIYSETLSEINDLGIKIRNALDRYKGTVEGLEIQTITYLAEDMGYSDEDRLYLKIQTYSFRYITLYNTLQKPTNLAIDAFYTTQLDLTWVDNATSETGYEVWRSTDLINYSLITTEAANTTSYSDSGLTENIQYYYKVRATNGTNGGEWSNIVGGFTTGEAPAGIVTDNLIFYIDASNTDSYSGSGTDVFDLSLSGNDGTLVNGVGYVSPNELTLDGVDDRIDMNSNYDIGATDSATWNFWIKKDSYSYEYLQDIGSNGGAITLGAGTSASGVGSALQFYDAGYLFLIGTELGSNWHPLNTWFNLTVVKTSNTNIEVFLNNVSIFSTTPANISFGGSGTFNIGSYANGAGFNFGGSIGAYMVYDIALSTSQINDNYSVQSLIFT